MCQANCQFHAKLLHEACVGDHVHDIKSSLPDSPSCLLEFMPPFASPLPDALWYIVGKHPWCGSSYVVAASVLTFGVCQHF